MSKKMISDSEFLVEDSLIYSLKNDVNHITLRVDVFKDRESEAGCAKELAHRINSYDSLTEEVERLREALNRVLKTSRGCSGRIILEEEDELDLIKAL